LRGVTDQQNGQSPLETRKGKLGGIKIRKLNSLEINVALVLTTMIFASASIVSASYPGPDYASQTKGDAFHGVGAHVKGWYYSQWQYDDTWHKAERFAIWPNIYVGNMKYRFYGSTYDSGDQEFSGNSISAYFDNFFATWAKTKAQATFHNVITKATWTHSVEATIVATP